MCGEIFRQSLEFRSVTLQKVLSKRHNIVRKSFKLRLKLLTESWIQVLHA